jgi:DNA polymerase/3'-5' exonuclease PolX
MGKRVTGEERGMQKGADIWDADQRIIVKSEEEIFKALGLPYVHPTERSYSKWRHSLPARKW